jgi:hypothetical protein
LLTLHDHGARRADEGPVSQANARSRRRQHAARGQAARDHVPGLQKVITERRGRIEAASSEIAERMDLARRGAHNLLGLLTKTAATMAACHSQD